MIAKQRAIWVVDDDAAVRASLQLLLEALDYRVTCFNTAEDLLDVVSSLECDCLLLDVRLPGLSGLDLLLKLQDMHPALPIIMITGHGDIPMAVQAIQQGAFDFLPKPLKSDELKDKIEHAIEQGHREQRERATSANARARFNDLTQRETQVFQHLLKGLANKQIAYDLSISTRTVEVHRANVMKKLDIQSVAELVRLAALAGIE